MNANEEQKQQYNDYVKKVTPTHNLPCEMFKAFVTGGVICLIGQLIRNMAHRWAWTRIRPAPGAPSCWFS